MDTLCFALGVVAVLTWCALMLFCAAVYAQRESREHDNPMIDFDEDEAAVACALEGNLAFHLQPSVHLNLNRTYH